MRRATRGALVGSGLAVLAALIVEVFFPASPVAEVVRILDTSYVGAALRLTVPIAFAAIGGIFAEKSGVINIGLEGLLIVAAFTGVAVVQWMVGSGGELTAVLPGVILLLVWTGLLLGALAALGLLGKPRRALVRFVGGTVATGGLVALTVVLTGDDQSAVWLGFFAAVVASTSLALLFAVITIDYRADQIIGGLAVWLVALGAAPFASNVIWGAVNSPSVPTLNDWTVPLLSAIPWVGPVLFDANPTVYLLLVTAPVAWYVINNTAFGYWVRASGENPKALDTAGVDVRSVRYAAVLLSGVLSGIGGAGLSLGQVGQFIGSGATMVSGRGWIGITAYLFGNYNPLGAFGASLLFASLDALQIRLQQLGYGLSPALVQSLPFVTVIVVLALVGRTRIPDAAGEHYESGEE